MWIDVNNIKGRQKAFYEYFIKDDKPEEWLPWRSLNFTNRTRTYFEVHREEINNRLWKK